MESNYAVTGKSERMIRTKTAFERCAPLALLISVFVCTTPMPLFPSLAQHLRHVSCNHKTHRAIYIYKYIPGLVDQMKLLKRQRHFITNVRHQFQSCENVWAHLIENHELGEEAMLVHFVNEDRTHDPLLLNMHIHGRSWLLHGIFYCRVN